MDDGFRFKRERRSVLDGENMRFKKDPILEAEGMRFKKSVLDGEGMDTENISQNEQTYFS